MVSYPDEVSMKGDVVVTQFKILSKDNTEETTTRGGSIHNPGDDPIEETEEFNTTQEVTDKETETSTTAEAVTANNPEETIISDDLKITGYQMTAYFKSQEGVIGNRVNYQIGSTVDGQIPQEIGLVYGLDYDYSLTEEDLVVDSNSEYVASFAATEQGNITSLMEDSSNSSYYAMTMNSGENAMAFTTEYYVRVYSKLNNGQYRYSEIKTYRLDCVKKSL